MKSRKARRTAGRLLVIGIIGVILSAGLGAIAPDQAQAADSNNNQYAHILFEGRIWPGQACAVPVHTNWNYEYRITTRERNPVVLASGYGTANANGAFSISAKAPADRSTWLYVVVRGGYAYYDSGETMIVVPGTKNSFKRQFIMRRR